MSSAVQDSMGLLVNGEVSFRLSELKRAALWSRSGLRPAGGIWVDWLQGYLMIDYEIRGGKRCTYLNN